MRTVIERFFRKMENRNLAHRVQKSQILMSFLTLIVCVGVLCTGSWAYFTDSATVFVAEIYIEEPETTSQLLELELQTTVAYTLEEPEAIAETEQPEEENGADSEKVAGEPQEITEELPENAFTAPQDGKYQFTMVFSGNAAGYGKITVTDGKETDGTEKIYVTEAVTPTEDESVEYSVVIQLATDCTVSFEACLEELPEDIEIVKNETEILFSNLENTEEQPTEGTASDNSSEEQPTEEPSEEEPTEEDPVIEPSEGETSPEAGEPVPETGNQEPEAGDPAPEDGEPAPQTEPQPQAAEEETEVSEE